MIAKLDSNAKQRMTRFDDEFRQWLELRDDEFRQRDAMWLARRRGMACGDKDDLPRKEYVAGSWLVDTMD